MDTSQCVHCGLCLSACPTYAVTGLEVESPRGRLVLLNEWRQPEALHDPATAQWLDDCLDCRACESVCPAHVPTGHLVEQWRAQDRPTIPRNLTLMRGLGFFVGSTSGLRWFQRLSRWSRRPWGTRVARSVLARLPRTVGDLSHGLPQLSLQLSRETIGSDAPKPHSTVMFFVGCVMDAIYSESNRRTAELLRLAGYAVVTPSEQRCCGALHLHSGESQPVRIWAQENIRRFEESGADKVVVNAAGCGTTLKEYAALFAGEPQWEERARRFEDSVVDVTVLLAESMLPRVSPTGRVVTVHDACHHAHAQKIFREPRQLLARAGYTIHEMANSTQCCGSAGVYNLTHPDMSEALVAEKLASIPDGVTNVAAANPGCLLQIQAAARRSRRNVDVQHPVDLVWQAYHDAGYLPKQEVGTRG